LLGSIGIGGWSGRGGVGLAQNFEHHGAAGGAFALDGFAAVFHGFFNAIGDGLFGLALDAVSFRHKKFAANASCVERLVRLPGKTGSVNSKRKPNKTKHF
jgi:hypothetical protein